MLRYMSGRWCNAHHLTSYWWTTGGVGVDPVTWQCFCKIFCLEENHGLNVAYATSGGVLTTLVYICRTLLPPVGMEETSLCNAIAQSFSKCHLNRNSKHKCVYMAWVRFAQKCAALNYFTFRWNEAELRKAWTLGLKGVISNWGQ